MITVKKRIRNSQSCNAGRHCLTSHLLAQFVQVKQGKTFRNPHEDTLKRPLATLTLKGPTVTSRGWTRSTLAFPPIGLLAPVRLAK